MDERRGAAHGEAGAVMGRPDTFTREEDAYLLGYFALGLSAGQIALKMGREPAKVRDRIRHLGVKRGARFARWAEAVSVPYFRSWLTCGR